MADVEPDTDSDDSATFTAQKIHELESYTDKRSKKPACLPDNCPDFSG